ncbi:MAG: hypothetical protein LBH55_03745, partial [Mycoplasmataceae bacterium]|nr:hypothetical protein [Mycoplasmataceae bacterium]
NISLSSLIKKHKQSAEYEENTENEPVWFKNFVESVYMPSVEKSKKVLYVQNKRIEALEARITAVENMIIEQNKILKERMNDIVEIKTKYYKN